MDPHETLVSPALVQLTRRLTGKRVNLSDEGEWVQDLDEITTPFNDEEGLVHELCHWIIATDDERTRPNLALDPEAHQINEELPPAERLPFISAVTRERQTCELEKRVYALRGWLIPDDSPCVADAVLRDYEADWLEERLAAHGGDALLQEIANTLSHGRTRLRAPRPLNTPTGEPMHDEIPPRDPLTDPQQDDIVLVREVDPAERPRTQLIALQVRERESPEMVRVDVKDSQGTNPVTFTIERWCELVRGGEVLHAGSLAMRFGNLEPDLGGPVSRVRQYIDIITAKAKRRLVTITPAEVMSVCRCNKSQAVTGLAQRGYDEWGNDVQKSEIPFG